MPNNESIALRRVIELQRTCSDLTDKLDRCKEALGRLVHLHMCEQEGMASGMPTFKEWVKAVEQAGEVLTSLGYIYAPQSQE
jgi:hypothetical protein